MHTYNIHQAKTQLSRLLDEAIKGDEVIIAKAGKPLAKLVALVAAPSKRKLGCLKGKFSVPANFDQPLPQIADLFEEK